MLNLFGHDPDKVYVVDIESDDLTVTHDLDARVYLIGVTHLVTRTTMLYRSVQEWLDDDTRCTGYDDDNVHVFHNASFDVSALRLRGVPLTNYFCTMVASHTFNPGSSDEHSLAALRPETKVKLRELLIDAGYAFKGVKKGAEYSWYGKGDIVVDGTVEVYLYHDLAATCDLYLELLEKFEADSLALNVLLTVNIPYIECILSLQAGTAVEYDASLAESLQATADHALAEACAVVGWMRGAIVIQNTKSGMRAGVGHHCKIEPFNPNSHKQVASELIRLYGWEPTVLTDAGAPSTSTEVLEVLDYPLVEHLLNNSKATKLLSFCNNIKEYDGSYMYPSYNQCATRTTRLSCSGPNVQQIPSRDPLGKNLRKMFVCPEGYELVVGDESGFQLRIAAAAMSYYFDDNRLVDCFNNGDDVHQFFADIYGIKRKIAKNVTFGYMFGAGPAKMAATANRGNTGEQVTVALIKDALKSLEDKMPALPLLKELYIENAIQNKGVIHDWLGTRYTIPELLDRDRGIRAGGERKCFNYFIQGMEASWFRKMQVQAQDVARRHDAHMYIAVHDEVGYICPTGTSAGLIEELNVVYSPAFSDIAPGGFDCGGLRLETEFNVATNWYDAK